MAAEIVNLRQARKRKARADQAAKAAENRELFGRPKALRRHQSAMNELENRDLNGKLRVGRDADEFGNDEN